MEYLHFLQSCTLEKDSLQRNFHNLWNEYGGITPATYNPKPLKAPAQSAGSCNSEISAINRQNEGVITGLDGHFALGNLVDPTYYQASPKACLSANPYANGANPRHCLLAEQVLLKSGQQSICGRVTDTQVTGNTEFGVQVDYQDSSKVPTPGQLQTLSPRWIRFLVPKDRSVSIPSNVSSIAIFNQQSFQPTIDPIGKTDQATWDRYLNPQSERSYIDALKKYLATNPNITAIEIWNEPDLTATRVPPTSYAKMLRLASQEIRASRPNIKIISGGLAGSDPIGYISAVKSADPLAFSQVDAVGLHPYGQSPGGWGKDKNQSGDLASQISQVQSATGKSVWITEIGQNYDLTTQSDYLKNLFDTAYKSNVPVLIWYSWTDRMLGGANNQSGWGLYNSTGELKPSGKTFMQYTKGAK